MNIYKERWKEGTVYKVIRERLLYTKTIWNLRKGNENKRGFIYVEIKDLVVD